MAARSRGLSNGLVPCRPKEQHVSKDDGHLVWIDLEMTGLEPEHCFILEIATIITNGDLELVAEGPTFVIHNTEEQLTSLSDWSRDTFTRSGLLERVRASTTSLADAERETLAFVAAHCPPNRAPLCGNSIHAERTFLYAHLRTLHDHLHYRNIDVSSFKEVLKRWYPRSYKPPRKAGSHEALADIRESIEELRYYRRAFVHPERPPG